jgi:NAD(P)-dependent dehydrogenase (short-subunit alcohol dehydrogenase family)
VNLIGVVNGVRAFVPHMRAHGEGGHIVNTASMAGMVNSQQGFAPYPAPSMPSSACLRGSPRR